MNTRTNAPRKKILSWLVGFFIVMLVLTMFAQSLRTMAIAQVSFARPRAQTIVRQFSGSGTVGVSESHPLLMDVGLKEADLIIDYVAISSGDRIELEAPVLRINKSRLEYALSQAEAERNKALAEASGTLTAAESALAEARNAMDSAVLEAERKLEDAAYKYEDAEAAYAASPTDAELGDKYDEAALALKRAREDAESTQILNQGKVGAAQSKLQAAQDAFDALSGETPENIRALSALVESDGVLVSSESGIITKVEAKPGAKLSDVLAYIAPGDASLIVSCKTAKKNVDGFVEGDTVYVKLGDEQLELTLTAIEPVASESEDDEDTDNVELKIALGEHAAEPGEKANVSLYSESAEYECVIPLNALRKDANGTYVFTAKEEGDGKYSAVCVAVNVLAQDSQNAAVSGTLNNTDRIIISSNKPIQEGDVVQEVRTP